MKDLSELRQGIDQIDRQLLDLFIKRMEFCSEVGEYKRSKGLPVLDAQREKQVLAAKMELLENPEYQTEVYEFFNSIMAISRVLQTRIVSDKKVGEKLENILNSSRERVENPKVCYFGNRGSYSEAAAMEYFGEKAERSSADTFEGVFRALEQDEADYAVAPIENSSTGAIAEVMDLLERYGYYIVGEINLPIRHCLLAKAGTRLSDVKTVYSHEQGLLQSKKFLKSLGKIDEECCCSTALSAKLVAESQDPAVAAIAGRQNAEVYHLEVLAENINSSDQNTTRFAVISKVPEIVEGCDKISIAFTLPHESGELHRLLSCFARGGLNLLKLESRPIPNQRFEYMFFVDYTGNLLKAHVREVTETVMEGTQKFKLLGNYRAGTLEELHCDRT